VSPAADAFFSALAAEVRPPAALAPAQARSPRHGPALPGSPLRAPPAADVKVRAVAQHRKRGPARQPARPRPRCPTSSPPPRP